MHVGGCGSVPIASHVPHGRAEDVGKVGDAEAEAFVESNVLRFVGLEEADSPFVV